MTLEDFFTLTEMKDGITAPSRVKELVAVMQKENYSFVKNVADATRQWAAVASTIAATENKECLDLFIQLDGLWFIDRWLKDAQTFSSGEANDCFVEEAISALLQAIEKLQIDTERLTTSGICITVESLFSCKSTRIQGKVRALFDRWKVQDGDVCCMDVEKATVSDDPNLNNEHPESQSTANAASPTRSLGDQKLEGAERGKKKLSHDQDSSQMTSDHADCKDGCRDTVVSPVKVESVAGDPFAREEICPSEGKLDQDKIDVISKVLKSESVFGDATHDKKLESFPDRSSKIEVSSASGASDSRNNSSRSDAKASEEAIAKPDLGTCNTKTELPTKNTVCDKIEPVGESSNGMDDNGVLEQKLLVQGDGSALEEIKDRETTISRPDDIYEYDKVKRHHKSERKYFGNSCKFERLTKNSKTSDIVRQTKNMDLEDGTVDALEVAWLVAKEVEREVVCYYEQSDSSVSSSSSSLSSPEKMSRADARQSDNLESMNQGKDQQIDNPVTELPKMENASPEKSRKKELLISSDSLDTNTKNNSQDIESSQVTDAVQERGSYTLKSFLEFDLNKDFSSEALDHHMDTVSSVFRPASPRGLPSGESSFELSPKRPEQLKFDLNRTEEDGGVPSPASSSCMQPSVRNFDLNDNLSDCNESSDKPHFPRDPSSHKVNPNPFLGPPDDSVISILGTKLKKNTFPPSTPLPFLNRRASEPVMGLGPAVPYPQPIYGYNGLAMGPLVPLAPTYRPGGPMPCMFDSRVVPFVPQIIGSTSTVSSSYCQQPSLVMNLMGATRGPNGADPLHGSLDLNSGYANAAEMQNREPGIFRQLFIPGQDRPSDEQLRDSFRPLSSGFGGGKRKEPDSGWELFTANYKHHQPPHL